ncbi:meiotic sister-chromatid recombination aldehyde dehydrogenase [Irpex rosettiformis]|uniref:Meiotic sister-chromatid recombination aldehyde dehydrogenase n=1 Tax=Irpex rosettiformis TaxID=378272 RepID=A0ACB8UJ33_9APHY|nr:meiotic sister-chromatid recombination aldehyde dehydrogenase [Irpex rosettiformis]
MDDSAYYSDLDDYDDAGLGSILYPLSICFAVGIWLVVQRYHSMRNRAVPFRYRAPEQIGPDFQAIKIADPTLESHLLDPALMPARYAGDRRYITCYDPATAWHLGTLMADTEEDIVNKITLTVTAQNAWKNSSFADRRKVIRSLKKWLVDNREVCAKVAARDTGKTLLDAALGEILTTASKMDWLVNHGERYLKPESRTTNWLMSYKSSKVYYEPLGVVAAIVSWNYPLHNLFSPILAALFSGNGIVVKCSENVIWSSQWFINAIKTCLEACGQDPELVQLVCCYPENADTLTKSPWIKHITFIGSEEVGRKVVAAAAESLTPVTLELGGKDPAIVMPSTDIKQYASIWMRGLFQNAGQNCVGIERLIVHRSQYDEIYATLVERTKELRLGTATCQPTDGFITTADVGAMINSSRFSYLESVLESAQNHGATIDVGGGRWPHPYLEHGSYFSPTVVGDVDPKSQLAQLEMFAPIASIIKYDTLDEAIDIANSTKYGLGASVFGPDQEQCVEKVAKYLQCGMVSINDFGVFYVSQDLPFGGVKLSGYGRFGGPEGLRSLCSTKAIVVDRWPWLVTTSIPKVLDYPIGSVNKSWDFVSGLIGLFYSESWRGRFDSLLKLMNASGK